MRATSGLRAGSGRGSSRGGAYDDDAPTASVVDEAWSQDEGTTRRWPETPTGESTPYRGRRRLLDRSRRVALQLRIAAAAVAVGMVLVGASVVALVSRPDDTTLPFPPPTPQQTIVASPTDGGGRAGRTAAPEPSASTADEPAAPASTGFEAEAAEHGSHAQVQALAGASGGQVVKVGGQRDGAFVRFTVTVATAGRHDLTIFYLSDQNRTGAVSVNDGPPAAVTFDPPGAGVTGSVTLAVDLAAGGNTVWIGTSGGAPLYLDRIVVSG